MVELGTEPSLDAQRTALLASPCSVLPTGYQAAPCTEDTLKVLVEVLLDQEHSSAEQFTHLVSRHPPFLPPCMWNALDAQDVG